MDTAGWAISIPVGYRVGRWEVTEPLGTGSWGSVYAATPVAPDAGEPMTVAVKFLPTRMLTARRIRHLADMAHREARAYEELDHPRLLRHYETIVVTDSEDPDRDGAIAVVMERADRSLADLIDDADGTSSGAAEHIAQACDALAYMHAKGWVHGDLKPSNVMIVHDGSLRLADFGLATELDGTHGYLPPAGSSEYSPPERQAERPAESGTAVRPSADVWALGVTAHQLLSGRSPFAGASGSARSAAAAEYAGGKGELVMSADIPAGWRAFVADCLAADAGSRPAAAELAARARLLVVDPEAQTRRPWSRRGRITAALLVAAAVGAGTAVTLLANTGDAGYERWFRTDAGIPPQYYDLIVEAGTTCDEPGVSPALVAAILAAESNFDPELADPERNEYGIARWTPAVLQYHLPPGQRDETPVPPFPPELSIPAVGRYLCQWAPSLEDVPGEQPLKLAAAYRTSTGTVREEGGVPDRLKPYTARVAENLRRFQPGP